ncbi:MAG: pyridoxal phosphate-dependent aminotransferase [Campylobacterales bacterium]
MFAKRATILQESVTIAITSLARRLKAEGKDILSFGAGEPDFDTPEVIKNEAKKALDAGFTKYTAVEGIPDLLQAIADKLKRENNLNYSPKDIIVSNGAKQSLFNLFACVVDEGDEVIVPAPYWVTYPELARYFGGVAVEISTSEATNFKITPEMLQAAITPKTKMLVLTSPSNPTGSVYTRAELEALAKVLEGTNIIVCADEMYEKLLYTGESYTSAASISDDMFKRTITINGLSKSVAMTGWRMGYLASPNKELINYMINLQSQSTSNINSITQKASIVALRGDADKEIESMRLAFKERRDRACELINAIPGLSVLPPDGAFYLFVNIQEIEQDSMKFCKELLEEKGVAVVPGAAFGAEGYFRFSFATDMATIEQGISRIADFCAKRRG